MSVKWTGNHSETGILRKSEFKEKKEELFVFGYSCKLFRNDDRAQHIDQGKHLIPWMGDETLKIDRYDARGALHDLSHFEAPPGGYDWRVELTKTEQEVEQLCDEERYRALHTDEDEELMYKEEELKRLHAAGYGQVGFNYDTPAEPSPAAQPTEVDEPFTPAASFKCLFQHEIVFPETQKQNAIIEKTAKFIATQGVQMEILIKAKQRDNLQFNFLNKDDVLNPYYTALIGLVKAGRWPEKEPEVVEEKPPEHDEYLHPSLASAVIESAPSIPSIHYKPSADCDYTMLISKMRNSGGDSTYWLEGELPPPGTEPHPSPYEQTMFNSQIPPPTAPAQSQATYQQYAVYYQQYMVQGTTAQPPPQPQSQPPPQPQMKPVTADPDGPVKSTGLSLMKNYGSGSDTDQSDSEDSTSDDAATTIAAPPDDVKLVIDKMATYVARNGDEFADIVRAKNDPRFTFLDPADVYHPYYHRLMREKRGDLNGAAQKNKPPVSFSIKKMKEPDPILPKPALPYESSSDEDSDKSNKQTDKPEEPKPPQIPQQFLTNLPVLPPVVVYKMEGQLIKNLPTVKAVDATKQYQVQIEIKEHRIKEPPKVENIPEKTVCTEVKQITEVVTDKVSPIKVKEPSPIIDKPITDKPSESKPVIDKHITNIIDKPVKIVTDKPDKNVIVNPFKNVIEDIEIKEVPVKDNLKKTEPERQRDKESPSYKREKKRHKEHRSKSASREKRSRSRDREKRREKDRDRKRKKIVKDDLESEIISLEDNSDDMIDLTGDQSDSKGEGETEAEKAKQLERRRRAAEFLKKVGVDPAAAALPTNSLASAMVDTLESIRKKKAAEEEKRRRKEKRRRREKRDYEESEKSHRKSKRRKYKSSDDNDESDYESSKKKKRKKDKKTSKKKKKRHEDVAEEDIEEDLPLPANMDLSNTLKELRTNSPTKDLMLPDIEENVADTSSGEENNDKEEMTPKKKKNREYSEGEWSSDSEADSTTSVEEKNKAED